MDIETLAMVMLHDKNWAYALGREQATRQLKKFELEFKREYLADFTKEGSMDQSHASDAMRYALQGVKK